MITTVKEWTYRGCKLHINYIKHLTDKQLESVKHIPRLGINDTLFSGHHCGYVTCDIVMDDNTILEIDVHGGITASWVENGLYTYGFDCAHYQDTFEYWNIDRVVKETERLADNILAWASDDRED